MKKSILIPLFLYLPGFTARGQTKPHIYYDFVIVKDRLLAITDTGHIRLFDLNQADPPAERPFGDTLVAVAIAKDIHSALIIADNHHHILKYDSVGHSWVLLGNYPNYLCGITFDHANTCYLITSRGIVELGTKQTYLPDSGLNKQTPYHGSWPTGQLTYHTDEQDNIWVGLRYGEWGGDLFVFNTRLKRFLPLTLNGFNIESKPIQCICSNGEDVFISTGLDHFTTSGSMIRVKNYKASIIFDSSPYSDAHRKDTSFIGEYIGPTSFNEIDHCLYFYSQHGFFRGDPDKDISTIEKWEKIAQPRLKWSSGQMNAVGSPMNVRKIAFYHNSQMAFLTQLNGIGLLQDGHAVFLQ
jgi:hypothetical protein